MTDFVWIKREYFASQKRMEKQWTKLASSLLTTALPHLFTPYPHCAVLRDCLNQVPAARQQGY
jgi:type VI protein secretion system component VasA